MKRWRRSSDWTASRRVRGGLVVLGAISLGLLINTVYLFVLLGQGRMAMEDSVREDATWAAYQTDRQTSRMIAAIDRALLDGGLESLPAVVEAYDILYSRAQLLEDGSFALRFEDTPALAAKATRARDGILALAGGVDALSGMTAAPRPALEALRQDVAAVQADATELVLATNAALGRARVAQRAEVQHLQAALGTNVGLLVVGFAGIVALLVFQMGLIAKAGRKLAILGERNRASASRARAASRAKSTFLATMSHEIRTPLNGIIGASELLARTALGPDQEHQLSMVRQSGYHLLEVINDVLDFSKLESGKVDYEIHRVPLPEVAETLAAVISPRADLKRVRLSIDLPALEVGTDPGRLRQVLVNLAGNAVKFTTDGSVAVRGGLAAQDRLRIEIADTGIGIPPDAMPLLFREFSQVDGSASRSFGGSGLGLAICKRIVEGMGGKIGATSVPGQGSTFWFELPVIEPRPCGAPAARHAQAPDARQGAFSGRVLVVEDNPINSAVAQGLLRWLGVEVELARNGAEAVERISRRGFDLAFMDVQMPIMSGIEATRELRRRGSRTRIVGLTGNAFISDRAECLRAGMDEFLAKPVTEDKLARALEEAGLLRGAGQPASRPPFVEAPDRAGPAAVPGPTGDPAAEEERIDEALLADLLATLEARTILALLDDLCAEADALPAALEAARAAEDKGRADALLHSLKGAAGALGLSSAAAMVQALRRQGSWTPDRAKEVREAVRFGADRAGELVRAASPGTETASRNTSLVSESGRVALE